MATNIRDKIIEQAVAKYEADLNNMQAKTAAKGPRRLITISRQAGSGGRQIAEKIGEKLGITVWGKEILDELASQSGGDYQARLFEALDERTRGLIDTIIGDFFGAIPSLTYHHLLPKAILAIAQNDAVFVGRGVNLILPKAFRVTIKASAETRIRYLGMYNNMDPKAAEKRIKDADHQSDGFMKELAKRINVKYNQDAYDLGICTDRIGIDEAASIVLHAFQQFQNQHAE